MTTTESTRFTCHECGTVIEDRGPSPAEAVLDHYETEHGLGRE